MIPCVGKRNWFDDALSLSTKDSCVGLLLAPPSCDLHMRAYITLTASAFFDFLMRDIIPYEYVVHYTYG